MEMKTFKRSDLMNVSYKTRIASLGIARQDLTYNLCAEALDMARDSKNRSESVFQRFVERINTFLIARAIPGSVIS